MTRIMLLVLALAAAGSIPSCRVRHVVVEHDVTYTSGAREEIIVTEAPPAARVEVIPVAPSANHLWVGGYWARSGNGWVWVEGRYVVRPRAHAVWVPGHWERHPRGWIWVYGHWA